jgi:ribose transport system ATP-binding protein
MVTDAQAPPAVELRNISMQFGSTRALDHVDLRIGQGEVVGLVGQNGSGKSTLVKVLAGFHTPEAGGQLFVSGEEVALPLAPGQANQIGFSFVYQHLALSANLTVLENLMLGRRVTGGLGQAWSPINWTGERRTAAAMLARYEVELDLDRTTGGLPPVDQARLAIVRAAEDLRLYREQSGFEHSVLVLDEPTVFLPEEDIEDLFRVVRSVVADGAGVLFISHDLVALRSITDRVVVLRDGRKVAEEAMADIEEDVLIDLIVGTATKPKVDAASAVVLPDVEVPLAEDDATTPASNGGPARIGRPVSIEGLSGGRLQELSLDIAPGEIVGVAGLIGSGAEDLPYLVFGAEQARRGTLRLGDDTLDLRTLRPQRSMRKGMALVPADRALYGLSAPLSVWENIVMLVEHQYYRGGRFRRGEMVELAREAIDRFNIRPPLTDVPAGSLSGGNQQKVVMAKWLLARPRLMLLHEPTQGVDVGARRDIYRFIASAAATTDMAVLWVTTEFGELAEICSRVVVVSGGREVTTLSGTELNEDTISAAALRTRREVG